MNDGDVELLLANRAFLFSFLSRGFAEEPDDVFLDILRDAHTADEVRLVEAPQTTVIVSRYAQLQALAAVPGAAKALAHEYVRVFVGPGALKADPWESVHLSGKKMLFQKGVLDVRAAYREAGFLPVRYQHVPDDFIGIEFDFLNKMAARALEAHRSDDAALLKTTLRQSARFEHQHVCNWVDAFAEQIDANCAPGFYGPFAHLAALIAQRDLTVIDELRDGFTV